MENIFGIIAERLGIHREAFDERGELTEAIRRSTAKGYSNEYEVAIDATIKYLKFIGEEGREVYLHAARSLRQEGEITLQLEAVVENTISEIEGY
ncbi:hypothetical protein [uncultured Roseibium sp.]|uniref:hypothetical protein n=1 Tax=uncultured Roseibium sp. TaxID=1936171 RepID=UPI00260A1278|nr:hypothetical protein [uncultured Roseibium sp.]